MTTRWPLLQSRKKGNSRRMESMHRPAATQRPLDEGLMGVGMVHGDGYRQRQLEVVAGKHRRPVAFKKYLRGFEGF